MCIFSRSWLINIVILSVVRFLIVFTVPLYSSCSSGINSHDDGKSFCNSISPSAAGKTKRRRVPDCRLGLLGWIVMLARAELSYLLQLLSETGEYREAMELLKKALKLEPATKVRLCGWATSAS